MTRTVPSPAWSSRSSAVPAASGSHTSACSRAPCARVTGCTFGRDHEEKVTAIGVFDHGTAVQAPAVSAGEIAKLWGLGEIQIGDWIGDVPGRARHGEFLPPTLESVVAPLDPADGATASRRARAARGAGPADQRPAGRHAAGALRLALRRGAEGSHPGDAGERLRHRRRVPRDDADLHRASRWHRRGRRDPPRGIESVSRHDRARHRSCTSRLGDRFPAGGRSSNGSALPLQDVRQLHGAHGRVRSRGAAGGPLRLAGHGLRRDDDQVRVQHP